MSTAAIIAFIQANSTQLSLIGLSVSEILGSTKFVKANSITTLVLDVINSYLKSKKN